MKQIVFIILTYYPKEKPLKRLIDALSGYDVILIDNTPEIGKSFEPQLVKFQKQYSKNLSYIGGHGNLGYAKGAVIGMNVACKKGYEWMVLLNDDIEMNIETVSDAVRTVFSCRQGIAGPFPRYLDPKRWTGSTQPINKSEKVFDYLSGSFLAIHRDVVTKIGFFHEPYFLFYEDTEYCIRAKKAGFPLIQIPIREIRHEESSGIGKGSWLHEYYLARNHLLFIQRNAPVAVQLREVIRMPKTLWEHYRQWEWGALEGIRDFALRRFGKYKGKYTLRN